MAALEEAAIATAAAAIVVGEEADPVEAALAEAEAAGVDEDEAAIAMEATVVEITRKPS